VSGRSDRRARACRRVSCECRERVRVCPRRAGRRQFYLLPRQMRYRVDGERDRLACPVQRPSAKTLSGTLTHRGLDAVGELRVSGSRLEDGEVAIPLHPSRKAVGPEASVSGDHQYFVSVNRRFLANGPCLSHA